MKFETSRVMSKSQMKQLNEEYSSAMYNRDYKKCLDINHQIYESEFLKYRVMQEALRLFKKQKSELIFRFGEQVYLGEIVKQESAIKRVIIELEKLVEVVEQIDKILSIKGGNVQ